MTTDCKTFSKNQHNVAECLSYHILTLDGHLFAFGILLEAFAAL